jgi:hypothetical protein
MKRILGMNGIWQIIRLEKPFFVKNGLNGTRNKLKCFEKG